MLHRIGLGVNEPRGTTRRTQKHSEERGVPPPHFASRALLIRKKQQSSISPLGMTSVGSGVAVTERVMPTCASSDSKLGKVRLYPTPMPVSGNPKSKAKGTPYVKRVDTGNKSEVRQGQTPNSAKSKARLHTKGLAGIKRKAALEVCCCDTGTAAPCNRHEIIPFGRTHCACIREICADANLRIKKVLSCILAH